MQPILRDAGPADAAALAALGRRTFTETFGHLYSSEDLAAFLLTHSEQNWSDQLASDVFAVRIAEVAGEAVAYAKLGPPSLPIEMPLPSRELRQLYVLQPWQGAGVAQALMDWALAEARSCGARHIYLSVYVDNQRGRRFYERYGFTAVGTYAFMVGAHADEELILRRELE